MTQALGLNGLTLDFLALLQDFCRPSKMGIGWCDVAQALMVAAATRLNYHQSVGLP
jgi:hypothetical protein